MVDKKKSGDHRSVYSKLLNSGAKKEKRKKGNPIFNIFKAEWANLGNRKGVFVLYMTLFSLSSIVGLLTPFIIGSIFNSIQNVISSREELYYLMFKMSWLLGITLLFWIFHGSARYLESMTGFYVTRNFVNEKMRKVLALPTKWHKDHHSGDTIDKINKSSGSLSEFAKYTTFQVITSVISFIGSLVILFFIDWKIGLFATLYSFAVIYIVSKMDKRLSRKYKEINKFENKKSASIFDYLSNIITVLTLRLKGVVLKEVDKRQMASLKVYRESVLLNEVKWMFASVSIEIMVIGSLIYRAFSEFSLTGTILIGTLYMVYSYLNNVGNTFYRFAELYGTLIRINAGIVNAESIDLNYEKVEHIDKVRLPNDWENISLKNVFFGYDNEGKAYNLRNVNFDFNRGQKIALVGESGSGKSTILSLIRGLYDFDKGDVLCDGHKLPNGLAGVKNAVTLIPQDPEIFNNTFKYNITMDLSARKKDVVSAISMAQLNNVLKRLPKGLDTNIMEKGVSLSGGEKQRLALARGLLSAKRSDILLLDEPTSSVDSLNELKIHENVFRKFKDKTIISSIHRLHLLDKFDYIYLFEKGRIVGRGTFEEMKRNPKFDKVWRKYNREKLNDTRLMKNKNLKK
jgi:ATP-binding cassette, subfamily B, bacterial